LGTSAPGDGSAAFGVSASFGASTACWAPAGDVPKIPNASASDSATLLAEFISILPLKNLEAQLF
jgi:hypothetical protein